MRLETVLKRIGNEMIRHLPIAAVALVVSLGHDDRTYLSRLIAELPKATGAITTNARMLPAWNIALGVADSKYLLPPCHGSIINSGTDIN
jgi:hypothetical protein